MPSDPELTRLGELLNEVRGGLEATDGDTVLRTIFSTNNEIGRLSRRRGDLRDSLVELQMEVNLVTVQVKRGRFPNAREAFGKVDETFGRIGRSRAESHKEFIERQGAETN